MGIPTLLLSPSIEMFPGEANKIVFPTSIIKVKELGVDGESGVVEEGLLKTVKGVILPCLVNILLAVGRPLLNMNTLFVLPILFTELVSPFPNWDLRLFRPFSNISIDSSMKPFGSSQALELDLKPLPPTPL